MKLIIGLGNPGKKHKNTRHNIGFMLVDKLRETWNFPKFEMNEKFDSEISKDELKIDGWKSEILLVKPQTFMNNSGTAVKKIMDFFKVSPADLIVIHDDLDIETGKFKISSDSRAAGHNGVQNIIDKLGTQNFKRLRIGIEGEKKRKGRVLSGEDFVLQSFPPDELVIINEILATLVCKIQKIM